jgi:hypothetical protein
MVELQPNASASWITRDAWTHQIECQPRINLEHNKILIFFTTSLVSSSNRRRHRLPYERLMAIPQLHLLPFSNDAFRDATLSSFLFLVCSFAGGTYAA